MNKLIDPAVRAELWGLAMGQLYWPRKAPRILDDHAALYDAAADTIGRDTPVLYLEFGVASGRSILGMAERFRHPRSRFIGFDSFAGLPETWLHLPQGAFSTGGRPPATQDERIAFVAGWFQNTVHPFLAGSAGAEDRAVLVHFDADLYSSTLFLLSSLWPHLPRYHFMMDDFVHDDAIALFDFASAYPVEIDFLAQTRGAGPGPNPDQVLGHMRRVPFVLPGEAPTPEAPTPEAAAPEAAAPEAAAPEAPAEPDWLSAADGALADMLGEGWSGAEPWGVWGVGDIHVLLLPRLAGMGGDVQLDFDVEAAIAPARSQQVVEVSVNGETLDIWTFTGNANRGVRALLIPADLATPRQSTLNIAFRPRSVKSIAEISPGSSDTRPLGVGLHRLRLGTG